MSSFRLFIELRPKFQKRFQGISQLPFGPVLFEFGLQWIVLGLHTLGKKCPFFREDHLHGVSFRESIA